MQMANWLAKCVCADTDDFDENKCAESASDEY